MHEFVVSFVLGSFGGVQIRLESGYSLIRTARVDDRVRRWNLELPGKWKHFTTDIM